MAVLCADARDEDRQIVRYRPHLCQLFRVRGANHEATVAVGIPLSRGGACNEFVERLTAVDGEVLYLLGPRIRRVAEHYHALVLVREERLERFAAKVRTYRDGIRPQVIECGDRVALVGVGDIPPLGIKDDRRLRRHIENIGDGLP